MSYSKTLVLVGCGAAKRDEPTRAADLYTSTYFAKKREYAETIGDAWLILSAEHGLIAPERVIDPYETSIDDLDDGALDVHAHDVGLSLIDWTTNEIAKGFDVEEIVVLAGRRYVDPLRERDAFSAGINPPVTFPLQTNDLGGIGEQMSWLAERVEAVSAEQSSLVTDGGEYRHPLEDVDGLEEIEVECAVAIETPDKPGYCGGWRDTVELDEPAEFDPDTARVTLPGFSWECAECGQPHEFEVEGIRVSNLV
ncbi:DUF6884 domain-containing protein [Halobellus rarus]|uniref:DUF6884 domain-containing protein n=1 Tax=Halobellus rarus TaxID=1126237 RepID=A0ABD6CS20_9EURY